MIKDAYFAGGCFWCISYYFSDTKGIINVISGYLGGDTPNPTYEIVKSQKTKYRETIKITYDDSFISYNDLLDIYLSSIDPFDKEGQFIDKGFSYTLAIFYLDDNEKSLSNKRIDELRNKSKREVFIDVIPFVSFYKAEEYHQNYKDKNPIEFEQEMINSGRQFTCKLRKK